jgi:starvation-inducible DNA-binding protein
MKEPKMLDIVECLNAVLANEYSLFTKTLNYHWNITGPRFHSLHTFLEGQYQELLLIMDEVAERVRVLDERPISTIKGMVSHMEIKDGNEKPAST